MSHESSRSYQRFDLLNGDTSPDPDIRACMRVGGNGGGAPIPEVSIFDARRRGGHSRLLWDPDHRRNGSRSPFFSVAAVRLDVKADGECLLSVGTGDYLRFSAVPYQCVKKIQIAAAAGTGAPDRAVQWDWIELTFRYADGRTETRQSSCLPRVVTGARMRRAAQARGRSSSPPPPQQFAEISTGRRDVVEVKFRGQVTMRANDGFGAPLGADDLLGTILVFTDATSGQGRRPRAARV